MFDIPPQTSRPWYVWAHHPIILNGMKIYGLPASITEKRMVFRLVVTHGAVTFVPKVQSASAKPPWPNPSQYSNVGKSVVFHLTFVLNQSFALLLALLAQPPVYPWVSTHPHYKLPPAPDAVGRVRCLLLPWSHHSCPRLINAFSRKIRCHLA